VQAVARPLAYTTVLTMLRLLEQKGYLAREPSPEGGRAHVYRPTVSEDGVRRSHLRDLVDRMFGGRAEELAIGLVRDEALTRDDLEQLRAAIDARLGTPGEEGERGERGERGRRKR
jgi:predicted transcriptional regulator